MASATVRVLVTGSSPVAAVEGDVDLGTCPEIDAELDRVLDEVLASEDGFDQLTLDLSGVSFMGSSGLATLLRIQRRAQESGGRLVLSSPSRPVRELLAMTHLTGHFDSTDEDARS